MATQGRSTRGPVPRTTTPEKTAETTPTQTREKTRTKTRERTREKILRAAERLFAQQGFDRVTLRQIARASDQRNVAAVQYHFGSKDGLLSSIVNGHREEIDHRRRELLEEREAEGRGEELAALIEILVAPLAAKLDDPSGRAYLRIQARGLSNRSMRPATRTVVQRLGQHIGQHIGQRIDGHVDRPIDQRIGQHVGQQIDSQMDPDLVALDDGERDAYRARFALLLLFHALADRAQQEESRRAKRADRSAFVASLSRSLEGLFAAPPVA